jgi:hypothetical protein
MMDTITKSDFDIRWEQLMEKRNHAFNINNYINDGFEKVCEVKEYYSEWMYININKELMFSNHNSWVYLIVLNENIVKCGETGNPLGIPEQRSYRWEYPIQPIGNSKCRFGRLRKGDGTDSYIRRELRDSIKAGNNVSLWAKKCKLHVVTESLGGKSRLVDTSIHKHLEQMYLEHFKDQGGRLPWLNKASK